MISFLLMLIYTERDLILLPNIVVLKLILKLWIMCVYSTRGSQRLWKNMEVRLGIQNNASLLSLRLNKWWIVKTNSPCLKKALPLTP